MSDAIVSSDLLKETQNVITGQRGKHHPMVMVGLPLATWPFEGVYRRRGVSEGVSIWSGSHGGVEKSVHMLQLEDSQLTGVLNGVTIPSTPTSDSLDFLLEQFDAEKEYHTINTALSAIFMIHTEVDGVQLSQHPLVTHFLKGVAPYTSLYIPARGMHITVMSYQGSLPDNISLPFPLLMSKVTAPKDARKQ